MVTTSYKANRSDLLWREEVERGSWRAREL